MATKRPVCLVLAVTLPGSSELKQASPDNSPSSSTCYDCRLTSNSIEDLLKKPRLVNEYGEVESNIDSDKINKALCKDIINDKERERCRSFYFSYSSVIKKWRQTGSKQSFFDFVCIKELKLCCPRDSFGPRCTKCPECDVNKVCYGEGTRVGNGTCICKEGHVGSNCENCSIGFYMDRSGRNGSLSTICRACHRSCISCYQGGPLGCQVCRSGFVWLPGYGCSDEDECTRSNNKICGDNTFCVNTEGSYFCYGK